MVELDARRPFGAIGITVTLVIVLEPVPARAQVASALPSNVCAQSAIADSASSSRTMDRGVKRTLNKARRAINAEDYTDARALVDQLELDQLTPYERAMTEGVLFRLADAEHRYDEARQHVVRAIESCGLTNEGIANAYDTINRIDARLAADAACGGDALCRSQRATTQASTRASQRRGTPVGHTRSPWPERSPPIVNDQTCRGCTRSIDGYR
jgi:hypothetical protein